MPKGPNLMPVKKKSLSRRRMERRERYQRDHELNKAIQRDYARRNRFRQPDTAVLWDALSLHGRLALLALYTGMFYADCQRPCPVIPDGVNPLHAGFPTFSLLYAIYVQVVSNSDDPEIPCPLDRGDFIVVVHRLERDGWVRSGYEGILEDGTFGAHASLLYTAEISPAPLRKLLLGGLGDQGWLVVRVALAWFEKFGIV